jgi:hypothetical protein
MGSSGIALPFKTSTLNGGEWSASRSCRFILRERAPDARCPGTRAVLDAVEKRKSYSCRESNSGYSAHSPSLCILSYPDSTEASVRIHVVLAKIWAECLPSASVERYHSTDPLCQSMNSICDVRCWNLALRMITMMLCLVEWIRSTKLRTTRV